ncbi:MAG: right-handed parallel beta-helix repeat-containing protein, partial [Phycisphaerales bacterium]|nr:right-handed parallel beta-helix repeat-containing protein [Phycisphaerales bacterium]
QDEPLVITTYGPVDAPASLVPSDASSARPDGEHVVTYNVQFPDTPWDEFVEDGWTVFSPNVQTRVIYVSSTSGDDATGVVYDLNDPAASDLIGADPFAPAGEVRAFATPGAGYALLRDGYPDWLLLRRGDEWTIEGHTFGENLWKKSGQGPGDGRILVGSYGSLEDDRPLLRTDPEKHGLCTVTNSWNPETVHHVAFVGLHLEPDNRRPGQTPTGIRWLASGSDLLFEDMMVLGYKECAFSGGPKQDLALRRCVIADNWTTDGHSQGIFVKDVDGLLVEECVFDHNGWHETIAEAEPTTYNHNMYLSTTNTGVVVRRNISVRASATGCQARSGGDIVGNIFQGNPFGLNFGWTSGVELPHDRGSIGMCLDNIVIDVENRGYGQWGIAVGNIGARQVTPFRNNLIVGRSDQLAGLILSGTNNFGIHGIEVTRNVIYDFGRPMRVDGVPGAQLTGVTVSDNVLSQLDSDDKQLIQFRDADPDPSTAFRSNTYFSHLPEHKWFRVNSESELSIDEWVDVANEQDASVDTTSFPDPTRDLASYHGSLGLEPTLGAFMNEARKQRRGNWREAYTARAAGCWIREGFSFASHTE